MKWFFNDLYAVKQGMVSLMPKKWRIFRTYTNIYHQLMHDWLVRHLDNPDILPPQMLGTIDWSEQYYKKMRKLDWSPADLRPHVIDDREGELIREYRQLIVTKVEEWMTRMFTADKSSFVGRNADSLDTNEHGYFRTKTLSDMWRMLREQTLFASSSGRQDVMEGVIDAMFIALKSRQTQWQKMVDDDATNYMSPSSDPGARQLLQDWLVAIANDQISCIDDNEEAGQVSYLTRFQREFEPLVSSKYMNHAQAELKALHEGFIDLGTHCITLFVSLVFETDLRPTMAELFTPKWYNDFAIQKFISTFVDYLNDYSHVLHPSLLDILVEELADELLVAYLSSVRNKGAKFRRTEPFIDKCHDDVTIVFEFFENPNRGKPERESIAPVSVDFATIKDKWRAADYMVRLVEADKHAVATVYESFKKDYWDLQMTWVESALKARDDYDRATLNAVNARAAETYVERGSETIMSKVK